MPAFPITATTGDPVFRGISSSIDSVRRFSRAASDSAVKLNTQERIVSPGEDSLGFAASRNLRSQLGALRAVQESGQLNVTTLNLAIEGLEAIRGQLDGIKRLVVQAQAASVEDRDSIQAEIDLALKQIDSTAASTKVGGRSLLNGSSAMSGTRSIALNGTVTQFSVYTSARSFGGLNGIREVRVNKVGANGPIKTLNDGSRVLSLRVSLLSAVKATKGAMTLTGGAAGGFSEFRVTGKLGSATIRINSVATAATLAGLGGVVSSFNQLAAETGVALVVSGAVNYFTSVGAAADDFVKVEYLGGSQVTGGANGATIGNVGGPGPVGETQISNGRAAVARINGTNVTLGGEFGTTAYYQENGFDVEIDFGSAAVLNVAATTSVQFNTRIDTGIAGLLGPNGQSGDAVRYGIGSFTTEDLGRGNGTNSMTTGRGSLGAASTTAAGNRVLGNDSVANLGSGGALSLESARLTEAMSVIDRAVKQVVKEQARLGTLQSNFMDSVARAEVTQGNVSAADADILGVDAAAEITNLVQSQVGVSTATALSSQITGIQQTVLSLLRG